MNESQSRKKPTKRILLDTSFKLPERIVESDEKYIVYCNSFGVTNKALKGHTGTPVALDYLLKTEDDWQGIKPSLKFSHDRVSLYHWGEYEALTEEHVGLAFAEGVWDDFTRDYRQARRKEKFVFFVANGPFENLRNCMEVEELYLKLVEKPEWVGDMFNAFTDLVIEGYEELVKAGVEADGFHFADDIAYKNGMLFSPKVYRELLFPCHKRLCDFFRSRGMPVMFHTDGKLDEALPLLIEAGITAIQPIEAKAGNDVKELKKLYGKNLVFIGNIDVRKLSGSREEVENEVVSKVLAARENGGYIYHSDHSVPPSVNFDNYRYALELVRKYGGYNR